MRNRVGSPPIGSGWNGFTRQWGSTTSKTSFRYQWKEHDAPVIGAQFLPDIVKNAPAGVVFEKDGVFKNEPNDARAFPSKVVDCRRRRAP